MKTDVRYVGKTPSQTMDKHLEEIQGLFLKDIIATPSQYGGRFYVTGHLVNDCRIEKDGPLSGSIIHPSDRLRGWTTKQIFKDMVIKLWRERGLGWSGK